MIIKLIILGLVIYGVYVLFIREGNLLDQVKEKTKQASAKAAEKEEAETVVECYKCSVYVSVDEVILKDGHYYCSKECAELK
ncbi:MAG: hypothetical protein DSZ05_05360 [Sulfurospirillum sp.]|nr:MAG: hypothetical protein DSZ05_05360 [Sulfurospirillum sp.]